MSTLAITNGVVKAPSNGRVDELDLILRRMPAAERQYVARLLHEIGTGVAAMATLEKDARRLKKKQQQTPDGQRLERITAKLRQGKAVLRIKIERVQGAIEASCEGGASPGEIVADALPDPPKRLKRSR